MHLILQNAAWMGSLISTVQGEKVKLSSKWTNSIRVPPLCASPIYQNERLPPPRRRVTRLRKRQHDATQRFTALTFRVTVANKDLHKEVRQVTQEEEVLLQLFKNPARGGGLGSDNLFSHPSVWTSRASVGLKHDEWHIEKLEAPSASFWSSTVGAHGDYR